MWKSCSGQFLSAFFRFWEILNLNLTFATCRKRASSLIMWKPEYTIPSIFSLTFTNTHNFSYYCQVPTFPRPQENFILPLYFCHHSTSELSVVVFKSQTEHFYTAGPLDSLLSIIMCDDCLFLPSSAPGEPWLACWRSLCVITAILVNTLHKKQSLYNHSQTINILWWVNFVGLNPPYDLLDVYFCTLFKPLIIIGVKLFIIILIYYLS